MPYAIRSYEGQDEWVSKKWLAHMNLGNDIYMTFFGATKAEAEAKARAWYEKEKARFERIDTSTKQSPVKVMDEATRFNQSAWGENSGWGNQIDNDEQHLKEIGIIGRGHHFTGKVWMVKEDGWGKQKKRVDKSEVEALEADGWKRGGPRS